jgi:hypothetical protein
MADLPKSQGPEWVLYEEMPEDGEIVSFDHAGDTEGAFEICQSEAGAVGTIAETTQGGLVCRTASGANDSFYVLQLAAGADDGEAGDLDSSIKMTLELEQPEMGVLPPLLQFEFTDEEKIELGEAMAETDAMKRMTEECAGADRPDSCGPKPKQGIVGDCHRCEDDRAVTHGVVSTAMYTFSLMGWMDTYQELQTELGADPRSIGR